MKSRMAPTVAWLLGCVLIFQSAAVAQMPTQPTEQAPSGAAEESLPDAPSVIAQNQDPNVSPAAAGGQSTSSQTTSAPPQQTPVQSPPPNQNQPQNSQPAQQPQGAAAAAIQPTTGTPAARPAGAALAPAKQKRSRSLLIKLGALAGVSIAVGTAVALSSASPSKPPGAN